MPIVYRDAGGGSAELDICDWSAQLPPAGSNASFTGGRVMRLFVFSGLALGLISSAHADPAAQQPLNLTCGGAGTANKTTVVNGYSSGSFSGSVGTTPIAGSVSGNTTVYGHRQQGFEDQVDVRLFSGDDRIRLPRTLLPPLHGGSDGWFKLKNVKADERSIHASAAVNFMNNPKVYIDRVTGTISISGKAGDYSGQCQAMQADAPTKF
jgi:hypothetical protein